MNNTENKTDNKEINWEAMKTVHPDKKILASILNKINVKPVTNNELVRNTSLKMEDTGRSFIFNNFTKLISNMNNYIKILSGGAIVSALIITLVIMNKPEPKAVVNNDTKVQLGGETLDIDSLSADLDSIDFAYDEPVVDDSDLTASLINNNDYEIQ